MLQGIGTGTDSFNHSSLSDVFYMPHNYMYALICDYEKFCITYGFVIISDFLTNWTCIPVSDFKNLEKGDTVYDCNGIAYIVQEEPYCNDDDDLYVETSLANAPMGSGTDMFINGDLYYFPIANTEMKYLKVKTRKEEEKLCPTLITKTKKSQN